VKKDVTFYWKEKQKQIFKKLKAQLTNALDLSLPKISKIFELKSDASKVSIGVMLLQGRDPIAYFSKILHGISLNYPKSYPIRETVTI